MTTLSGWIVSSHPSLHISAQNRRVGFCNLLVACWYYTVNGTKVTTDDVDPYHARIVHRDIVSIMIFSPFGGVVGGWSGAEDAFIADMKAAL